MKKDTFILGERVTFSLPTFFHGMKKYEGYIAKLPSANDLYRQYTIESFDGSYSPRKIDQAIIEH